MHLRFLRHKFLAPEGEGGEAGGQTDDNNNSPAGNSDDGGADTEKKFVPADAYERIQSDLVKWKQRARDNEAKISQWEAEQKRIEEEKAIANKDHETVIENLKAEKQEIEQKFQSLQKDWQDAQKYSQVARFLGNEFDSQYAGLIPFDQIELTEDGAVDTESAKRVAEEFKQKHPRLFLQPNKTPPGHYPSGGGGQMDRDKFRSLGKSKDMIKHVDQRFPWLNKK